MFSLTTAFPQPSINRNPLDISVPKLLDYVVNNDINCQLDTYDVASLLIELCITGT